VSATLGIWAIGLGLLPLACSLNAKGELYGRGDVTGSGSSASGASGSTSSGGGSTGMSGSSGTSGGGGTAGQGGAGGSGGMVASGGAGGAGGSGGQGGGPVELCGNGMIDPGEECDDQNGSPDDGCDACQAYCFDGEVEEPTTHHCYALFKSEKTRDEAKKACSGVGLYLATITSAGELALIAPLDDGDDRWLGGLKVNGLWTWETGEPWGFATWDVGQPNDSGPCLDVRTAKNVWNDDTCAELHDFICEWTPPGNKP